MSGKPSERQYASDFTTLVAVIDKFEAEGYGAQVMPTDGGRVRCVACGDENPIDRFQIEALRRTEGASDPADMAAVVALTCPACTSKGTMVLHFGPEASPEEQEVLAAMPAASRSL